MAEESGQERTEEATDKRKQDAREKGQVPRSRELSSALLLMGAGVSFLIFGPLVGNKLMWMMKNSFSVPRDVVFNIDAIVEIMLANISGVAMALIPVFAIFFLVVLISPALLGGFNFATDSLKFDLTKLSPLKWVKKTFSRQGLLELLKAIGKFFIVLIFFLIFIAANVDEIASLIHEPVERAIIHALDLLGWAFLMISSSLLVIAAIDVPFQLWQNAEQMKMTKQEVKDEMKQTQGNPEMRGKLRSMQQQMAKQRMMSEIPQADVVITNPTHYAVALKYDSDSDGAPILLAKGTDLIAQQIRKVANAHGILTVEAPPLARAIHYSTDLNEEIPVGLYVAVAQVLAYVFQLKRYKRGQGEAPKPLKDLPIPQELRH